MNNDFWSDVKSGRENSDGSLTFQIEREVKIFVSSKQEIKVGDRIEWRVPKQVDHYDVNVEQPKTTSQPTKESTFGDGKTK